MFLTRRLARFGDWPPTIAVSSWSLHNSINAGRLDILAFPRYARDHLGVSAVEVLLNHLVSEDEDQFRGLARSAESVGVRIPCLALDNDFTLPALRDREIEITRARHLIEKASLLGVSVVRVNTGIRGGGSDAELTQRVTEGLRQLIPTARQLGIRLALENQGLFGMRPSDIISVLTKVNDPFVGACLDLGNFYPEAFHTGPSELAPYALHLHAKAYRLTPNGEETTIHYGDRLRELRRSRFRGYASVEWECTDADAEERNAAVVVRMLERHLAGLK